MSDLGSVTDFTMEEDSTIDFMQEDLTDKSETSSSTSEDASSSASDIDIDLDELYESFDYKDSSEVSTCTTAAISKSVHNIKRYLL